MLMAHRFALVSKPVAVPIKSEFRRYTRNWYVGLELTAAPSDLSLEIHTCLNRRQIGTDQLPSCLPRIATDTRKSSLFGKCC